MMYVQSINYQLVNISLMIFLHKVSYLHLRALKMQKSGWREIVKLRNSIYRLLT